MYDKFKYIVSDDGFFYGVLIVLVAIASFGLGRVSFSQNTGQMAASGVIMTKQAPVEDKEVVQQDTASNSPYVASKNGSKYHLVTCPGAKQIHEENKIFFASKEAAQAQGFTPAGNCNGL